MRSLATIEIKPRPNGSLPVDLIRDAYRASRRGRIVLLLDGVDPARIDEIVDPLVHSMRIRMPGLRYVDSSDRTSVMNAMRNSCSNFLSQGGRLARSGIDRLKTSTLDQASLMLDRMNRPTRIAEINAALPGVEQAFAVGNKQT